MLLTTRDIGDVLLTAVTPAAGTAAVVFWLSSWLKWRRFLPSLAIALGFIVGNHCRWAVDWQAGTGSWSELGRAIVIEGRSGVPAWYWWPWLVGAALLAGSFGRWIGFACQLALGALAERMLSGNAGGPPAVGAAVALVNYWMLNRFARANSPAWLPAVGAQAMFVAAGLMLFIVGSARYAEMATLLGSAYLGVAVVAAWRKRSAIVTVPGISLGFPALMLLGFGDPPNGLVATPLLLLALAPSVLGVFPRRPILGIVLFLALVAVAVGSAVWMVRHGLA